MPIFCGQDNLLGGQFWAMGRFNLLGGQSNLLGGQMPTQLTYYLPPCHWEFESGLIQIPIIEEKVTLSYINRPNFGPYFDQNYPIFFIFFLNLSQF